LSRFREILPSGFAEISILMPRGWRRNAAPPLRGRSFRF
jgi:hypothetical protein